MITRKQAKKIMQKDLSAEMSIMDEHTITKDYGWVFFAQTKKYIETGKIEFMAVGSGGTLVESSTGRKIEFGSAYSTEENLEIYEKGYLTFENNDMVIHEVNDLKQAVNHIMDLALTYVIPEEESGQIWKIPRGYTYEQIEAKLKNLPCRLNIGNLYFLYEQMEDLNKQSSFQFSIEENAGHENCI